MAAFDYEVNEKDWKMYKKNLPLWQERYMGDLIEKYKVLLNDDDKMPSEKFWELHDDINKNKRSSGVMVELKRNAMVKDMTELLRKEIITDDDLIDFSGELKEIISDLVKYI